jgi:DNA-directed RNA polymerase specialized sigma24 family protein
MSHQPDLRLLTLTGIAHRCAQETQRFFQRHAHDPRYCYELFRRAIVDRNERAWQLVYRQYRSLVEGWVVHHSAFPATGEEVQYFVNRALERMWAALTPDKFGRFPDLKALLRYLQMCVHSAILDEVRTAESRTVNAQVDLQSARTRASGSTTEDQAVARVHRDTVWQAVNARLQDEKERTVVHGSFVLGLKPRELCAQYGDVFRDVREVYRTKENVLARLRRDPEIQRLLGADA